MTAQTNLVNLGRLMRATSGSAAIVVGIVDGPIDASHPDLRAVRLRSIGRFARGGCLWSSSAACRHGTAVAGILCGRRGSPAPAIVPGCSFVSRPVFREQSGRRSWPNAGPGELAEALVETIDAGARVINLSLAVTSGNRREDAALSDALTYASQRGTVIVAASGNEGRIGGRSPLRYPWVIPVVACDERGSVVEASNLGPSIGRTGLRAPGVVSSTSAGGTYHQVSGTSFAAPFVTGAIALLWSLFPLLTASAIRLAVLRPDAVRRSIVPPLLDAQASWQFLSSQFRERVHAQGG